MAAVRQTFKQPPSCGFKTDKALTLGLFLQAVCVSARCRTSLVFTFESVLSLIYISYYI
jgi:hypothetical protein